jgi:hypothetical protein
MPSEAAHIALACHNVQAACFLNGHPEYHDWTTVTAFYAALHFIDAVLFKQDAVAHGQTHDVRESVLKAKPKYANLYKHYRPLASAALIARYLESKRDRVSCSTFSEYMTPEKVLSEVLKHRLVSVIQSTRRQLPTEFGDRLDGAERAIRDLQPQPPAKTS